MSVLPTDTEFRVVLAVLVVMALGAIFGTADPLARSIIAMGVVCAAYLLFSRGKR